MRLSGYLLDKMDNKKLASYKNILSKHGNGNIADEELFEIVKNVEQLADVISAFEKKKLVDKK